MKPTPNEADTDLMTDEIRKTPRVIETFRRPGENAVLLEHDTKRVIHYITIPYSTNCRLTLFSPDLN
jgi:hypothetical protein